MKSRDTEDLFVTGKNVSKQDSERRRAKSSSAGWEHGSEENDWNLSKENRSAIRDISFEITDDRLEAMNRRVMDRIYEESPWLVPGEHRRARVNPAARKYMSVWIAGFLAVFLCSFLFLNWNGSSSQENPPQAAPVMDTGILPTGLLETTSTSPQYHYHIKDVNSGIMDPLVASIVPTYPQYWMLLSVLALALALFSLGWIHRARRVRN
ncbi:anti-sigma factor [Paenibacillus sp. LX16]|uniref:anti-sigma factor n=1 Tax=Paenibacillus sp. LX16 TaxID=1740264 RepID=UPI002E2A345E|nr:anti-sigma factor [Paenibacillus sp. LX16]